MNKDTEILLEIKEPTLRFNIPMKLIEDVTLDKHFILFYIYLIQNYDRDSGYIVLNQTDILQFVDSVEQFSIWVHWLVVQDLIQPPILQIEECNLPILLLVNKTKITKPLGYGILYDFEIEGVQSYCSQNNIESQNVYTVLAYIRNKLGTKRTGINPLSHIRINKELVKQEIGVSHTDFSEVLNFLQKIGIIKTESDVTSMAKKTDIVTYEGTHFTMRYRLEYVKKKWGIYFPYTNLGYINGKQCIGNHLWLKPKRETQIQQAVQIKACNTNNVVRVPVHWLTNTGLTEYRAAFYACFAFVVKRVTHTKSTKVSYSPNELAKNMGYTGGNINRKTKGDNMLTKLRILMEEFIQMGIITDFIPAKFVANKRQESMVEYSKLKKQGLSVPLYDFEYDFILKNAPYTHGVTPAVTLLVLLYIRQNCFLNNDGLSTKANSSAYVDYYNNIGNNLGIREVTISKIVDFLEGSGFIKTFRKPCLRKEGLWQSSPVIMVMQYQMKLVNKIYTPCKKYEYNYHKKLEYVKHKLGVYNSLD